MKFKKGDKVINYDKDRIVEVGGYDDYPANNESFFEEGNEEAGWLNESEWEKATLIELLEDYKKKTDKSIKKLNESISDLTDDLHKIVHALQN